MDTRRLLIDLIRVNLVVLFVLVFQVHKREYVCSGTASEQVNYKSSRSGPIAVLRS